MQKLAVLILLSSFLIGQQTPQPSPSPAATNEAKFDGLSDGIYYRSGDKYLAIEPLMMSGGGAKHVAKMFVPGLTPQMVWTYRGAEAPVRFADQRPVFYYKISEQMATVPGRSYRDLAIVQFDKKKDHRELQTTNGGNAFTFKSGFSKERWPEIDIEKVAAGVYRIAPKEDLKPGEYLIAFGIGFNGYDFGIDQAKK